MKKNYKAWNINIEDFYKQKTNEEKLRFLLNFAVLAPSSHNSQPWSFVIKDNSILISPEQKRRLSESDKNDRQLYISLGCAVENIIIAADYYGYKTSIDYQQPIKITFFSKKRNIKEKINKNINSILNRIMNRNKYNNTSLPIDFLEKIKLLSNSNLSICIIEDTSKKNLLADTIIKAGIKAMENKDFRKELSQYVKSNITKSKIGMPGFSLGIPTPVSLIISILLKYINMNKLSKKQDEKLLKEHTPAFIVISTKDDNREAWVQAGKIYENIAIFAENNNIKTSVLAAPIQIGEFYKDLQKILNTNLRPQVLFRIGYTNKIPKHSPRLEISDVIK